MNDQTQMANPVLAEAEQKIESSLTPQNRVDYMKAVVAGLQAGMSGGADSILASLKDSKDPINDCAVGAINLSLILRKQSRNTMPLKCMIPASNTLMLKALDFAGHIGLIDLGTPEKTNTILSQATHIWADHLFKCFNITPEMLQTAMGKVQQMGGDDAAIAKMGASAGMQGGPQANAPAAQTQE